MTNPTGHWRPLTKQEALDKTDLPTEPRKLPCFVCDELIGAEDWDWAAMPGNGPVHARCFMTDEQLLAELDDNEPCTGCDTNCERYEKYCSDINVLGYGDGVNNCFIVRPGAELDSVADQYRAAGYKVVH